MRGANTAALRLARALSVAALVAAVAVVAVLVLSGGSSYRVHALFQDAGQLVKGDRVLVGGVTIGEVSDITLDDHSQAVVTLKINDGDFHPLHDGTRASPGARFRTSRNRAESVRRWSR